MDNFKYVTNTYKKIEPDLTFENFMEKIRTDESMSDTIGTSPEFFDYLLKTEAFSEKFLSMFVEFK